MKYIVANFKMNGSKDFVDDYFRRLQGSTKHQIILCPPFPYLERVQQKLSASSFKQGALQVFVGGQNCSAEKIGARTGEISASMLVDMGCRYVILGHSERRTHQGESSKLIKEKAQEAVSSGLIPIICVGETTEQRLCGTTHDVILEQLEASIPEEGKIMIAYEPVWAIGSGKSATCDDISHVHDYIRAHPRFGGVPLLYGGSVSAQNISEILATANVDGVLVGGASLDVDQINIMSEG
jgi:triosephosphate isomerase (TIM)